MDLELQHKIVKGEFDINNQVLFVSNLFKSFLYKMNNSIKLRDKYIPHYVLNTGDDIMYLEHKGQNAGIEPVEVSNESYIYMQTPRCIVDIGNMSILDEQLTNPFIRGQFDVEYNDMIYGFTAEFRRLPIKLGVTLNYYVDSFTDMLEVTQHVMSKLVYIQTFKFDYMGQTITASFRIPSDLQHEKNINFDGGTVDSKLRKISIDLDIESNMPVFSPRTAICLDNYIKNLKGNIIIKNNIAGEASTADREYAAIDKLLKELEYAKISLQEIIVHNDYDCEQDIHIEIDKIKEIFGDLETVILAINNKLRNNE